MQRNVIDRPDTARHPMRSAALAMIAFVVLMVLVTSRWTPLMVVDQNADVAAHTAVLDHSALVRAADVVTGAGSELSVSVLICVAALALLIMRRMREAAFLVAARLVQLCLAYVAKHVVARHRPALAHPVAHASGFSFPSGHATGTALLCVSVLVLTAPLLGRARRWWVYVVAAAAIVAVAASRVLLGVHYPSDVVGGILLGVASGLGTTPILWISRRYRPGHETRPGPSSESALSVTGHSDTHEPPDAPVR